MKKIILLPILFISLATHAEFSEIQDPDGYSNLREQPNTQSRILTKIPNGTHVYTPEMEGKLHLEHGWQMTYDLRGKKRLDGWVHTSRLIPLSRYESIPVTATTDGFTCQKNGMGVRIKSERFNYEKEKHLFTHDQYGLSHYRGKEMFGTDGTIPFSHYREIAFFRNGKIQIAPRAQYDHLFDPYFEKAGDNTQLSHCYYRAKDDTLFLTTVIGDGAAYTEVLFVFRQGILKNVLASLHPEV